MRITITLAVASLVISSSLIAECHAVFIQPDTISASETGSNADTVLISNAMGDGDYMAPNPSGGGGGTSWHTGVGATTPVTFSFGFNSTSALTFLEELYVWDYYAHSPANWTLKLYSGAGQTGTELLDYDFAIVPGPSATSTKHVIDFTDVPGVLSGILQTRSPNSGGGGVGLAEFGFTQFVVPPVPEPSTLTLSGLGFLALVNLRRRRRRA